MPKQPPSDKKIRASLRHGARNRRGADSVKSLLAARPSPVLASIGEQARRQASWRQWFGERLPPPLPARITGIVERDGALVLFAESAGWGVRLRYAVAELEAELRGAHPTISRVAVRVLPGRSPL